MDKFCGKCGLKLDEKGKCPNCDNQKNLTKEKTPSKKIALIITVLFAIVIAIIITAFVINNKEKSNSSIELTSNLSASNITESESKSKNQIDYTYYDYRDYSEDLAWINFSDDNNRYWGCIDKSGKLLFVYESTNINEISDFSNGYAYITYSDSLKVIDKSGKITGEYSLDETHNVVAYGDGYVCTEERIADYNSSEYQYKIFDTNGQVMAESSSPNGQQYKYFGQGVFGYLHTSQYNVYFPKVNKWIHCDDGFYFDSDDVSFQNVIYGGGYDTDDGYRGKIITIDTSGNTKSYKIPENYGWNWGNEINIFENNIILAVHRYDIEYLISFNNSDNSFKRLSEQYSSMINYDRLPDLIFSNGKIALPWNGSDDKSYIAMFDTEWNLINKPLPIDEFSDYNDNLLYYYAEDRLIIKNEQQTIVYDGNCNEVFSSSDCGYNSLSKYQDGVSRIEKEAIPTYLDKDGKRVFDNIDTAILE